ncbi:hypothetical protein [Streptomyces sp. NPDC020597]|uniref:hypothetical protein n=1 Tax=unclassified Streptomyces TaxID=2593676 RepID=UPI0037A7B167
MLVLALVMPVVMMAALFALDAVEDLLFPLPAPADEESLGTGMKDRSAVESRA